MNFWLFLMVIHLSVYGKESELVRYALLCVACDIPASRKVLGFLGHSATLGCSKCLKKYPGSVGNKDYSGFDISKWPPRHNIQHRNDVRKINACKSETKQKELELSLGCRYSVLLDLPYFDPIRMAVIDPMHNLYLGTAKHILKRVWHERNMINKKDYASLQECVDAVCVPSNLGRIPSKILSSFNGLTADQLKNWTNIFSLFALHSCLAPDDFECWRHFILASRILTQMQLSVTDIELIHVLLLQFCKRVERMYGSSIITPNTHLHCHLRNCLKDYGPVYYFWLFSFERYNGIFENFPTSTRVEIQLMQRFISEFSLSSFCLPESFQSEFSCILPTISTPILHGSLKSTFHSVDNQPGSLKDLNNWSSDTIEVNKPNSYHLSVFHQHHNIVELHSLFSALYPHISTDETSAYLLIGSTQH